MGLRERLDKFQRDHGLVTDVPSEDSPSTQETGAGHTPVTVSSTDVPASRSSAAAILLQRRAASANPPPVSPAQSSTASVNTPEPTVPRATPVVDQEFLDHFRKVADGSTVPGYAEFFRQIKVLAKHIKDAAALYAAALDASGVDPRNVLAAIDDRMRLVGADKNGAIAAIAAQQQSEISTSQARVGDITSMLERLRQEINERQRQITGLTKEHGQIQEQLSDISSNYQAGKDGIVAAAEQVLDEFRTLRQKIQPLATS